MHIITLDDLGKVHGLTRKAHEDDEMFVCRIAKRVEVENLRASYPLAIIQCMAFENCKTDEQIYTNNMPAIMRSIDMLGVDMEAMTGEQTW